MTRDSFDMFQDSDRGRFGDNESQSNDRVVKSNLVDLDLILHHDSPSKKAIAVSLRGDTPFKNWTWLPRSLIEFAKTGKQTDAVKKNGQKWRADLVTVTIPEWMAKEKGLI